MNEKLSSYADVFNGKTPSKSEQREFGHPVLKIKDVDGFGDFIGDFDSYVEGVLAKSFKNKWIKKGDILILNAAHNADYVGSKIYKAEKGVLDALPTGEWLVIRPKAQLNSSFVYHWILSKETRLKLRNLVKGIHLYPKDVAQINVSFPSLPEQQRIAEVLDKADFLRKKRRLALQKLDSLLQSVFHETFGDPVENPKGWEIKLLGELGRDKNSIVDGPFGSSINVLEDYSNEGDIPVIRTKNVNPFNFVTTDLKFITKEKFESVKRSSVLPGDIVLTKVGTIGNVCIFPEIFEEAVLSTTGSCRIRPNNEIVETIYLAYFLHFYKPQMLRIASTGVQAFLNMKHIKSFRILVPPLEMQQKFSEQVKKINYIQQTNQKSLAKSENLFQSLQQRAFKGELFNDEFPMREHQEDNIWHQTSLF